MKARAGATGSSTSVFRPHTTPSQGLVVSTGIMCRGVGEEQPGHEEVPSTEAEQKP